jgi:hypothetical protein
MLQTLQVIPNLCKGRFLYGSSEFKVAGERIEPGRFNG